MGREKRERFELERTTIAVNCRVYFKRYSSGSLRRSVVMIESSNLAATIVRDGRVGLVGAINHGRAGCRAVAHSAAGVRCVQSLTRHTQEPRDRDRLPTDTDCLAYSVTGLAGVLDRGWQIFHTRFGVGALLVATASGHPFFRERVVVIASPSTQEPGLVPIWQASLVDD